LAERFPNTVAGRTARNQMARAAFDAAMNKPTPEAKMQALAAIIRDKRFAGTDVFPTIQEEYAKLSGAK
jgi:hypothetical protein